MFWIFLTVLIAIIVFVITIVIRTLMFRPLEQSGITDIPEDFDKERAIETLRELVRYKTVSYHNKDLENNNEFEALITALPRLYPNVFSTCKFIQMPERALLFHWEGQNDGNPAVMMAHYDVVPVDEEAWSIPPFDAIIKDNCIWGRGTLDTKVTFNGILYAADHLMSQGFVPQNDIYFAFSGGEEVDGEGAIKIVDYFEAKGITPAFVIDEGGAVVENVFPGVKKPCGMIGIAEKGMMDVQYTVRSEGGHASAPQPNTPIDILSNTCLKVLKSPFPCHLTPPVSQMFNTLGRHSSFIYKMIFANIKVFLPLLDLICKKSGGELNALMRTTVAFTQMKGSDATNVIPPNASMVSNIRLNPYDNIEASIEYIKKAICDDRVEITYMHGMEPSPISRTDCDEWYKISSAVASTWRGCIVSPYLMVQCSDSRHYGRISDKVYRFSAMDLTSDERASIHGNNEHIRLETVNKAVEFFIRLIRSC